MITMNDVESILMKVMMSGGVIWLVPATFVAQCSINIQYYPFDSQTCDFLVSSWTLSEQQLTLYAIDTVINTDLFVENGEWELTGSSVTNRSRLLVGVTLPSVQFTIHLKRKYSYYLMNMVLPVIILALLAPFVFLLPVEVGGKTGFALTILLSMSVVMTIVSENIPPTSSHVCVLNVYLLLMFILCTLETFLTVVVCKIHDNGNQGFKMRHITQKVCRILATVTRYRRQADDVSDDVTTATECNKTAWSETEGENLETKEEVTIEYTYKDLTLMFDKFNLFFFSILTIVITTFFMITLQTEGFS